MRSHNVNPCVTWPPYKVGYKIAGENIILKPPYLTSVNVTEFANLFHEPSPNYENLRGL
jgi:hypothetical protein